MLSLVEYEGFYDLTPAYAKASYYAEASAYAKALADKPADKYAMDEGAPLFKRGFEESHCIGFRKTRKYFFYFSF